jgi:hypothetical protein
MEESASEYERSISPPLVSHGGFDVSLVEVPPAGGFKRQRDLPEVQHCRIPGSTDTYFHKEKVRRNEEGAQNLAARIGIDSQKCGGMITSRLPCPIPCFSQNRPSCLRIRDYSDCIYPEFPGCPNWIKPLVFIEYQVCSSVLHAKNSIVQASQLEADWHC